MFNGKWVKLVGLKSDTSSSCELCIEKWFKELPSEKKRAVVNCFLNQLKRDVVAFRGIHGPLDMDTYKAVNDKLESFSNKWLDIKQKKRFDMNKKKNTLLGIGEGLFLDIFLSFFISK